MEEWNEGFAKWQKLHKQLIDYFEIQALETLSTHGQGLIIGPWFEAYPDHKICIEVVDELEDIGHGQLSLLNDEVIQNMNEDLLKQICDVWFITAPLTAVKVKQPSRSNTQFSKIKQVDNWGIILIVLLGSCEYNLLNVFRFIATKVNNHNCEPFLFVASNANICIAYLNEEAKTCNIDWTFELRQLCDFLLSTNRLLNKITTFEFKPLSEKTYNLQVQWQYGYSEICERFQKLKDSKLFHESKSLPDSGIVFGCWDCNNCGFDEFGITEQILMIQQLSNSQLQLINDFPKEESYFLTDRAYREAGHLFCTVSPMVARLHKNHEPLRFKQLQPCIWGGVIAILVSVNQINFITLLKHFMSGYRIFYNQEDFDHILSLTNEFYNIAKIPSSNYFGMLKEDFKAFESFLIRSSDILDKTVL